MLKRFLAFMLVLVISSSLSFSQADTVSNWKTGGFVSISFSNVSLTNWAKGGESTTSGTSILNLYSNYKTKLLNWENTADFGYGLVSSEEFGLRKNEDKIDLSSKFGHKAFSNFFYSALLNFKTQFADGYNYPNDSVVVSQLFAPAYLQISVGLDYKPFDWLSVYMSPASGRFIFVMDQDLADKGAYSVEKATYDSIGTRTKPGERFRADFGASVRAKFAKDIYENVRLESKLDLFNNFTDKNEDNRKNIDVNWETMIVLKINSFLTANIFTHLIYDHDILVPVYKKIDGVKTKFSGRRLQTKNVLGIGLSYKF